ncbi:hypothetical protein MVEN_00337100 [Mycena venus]|uniref:Uncharacterized protein n=1 Tax=Mycena venus TaxID=2733690 RepID=A0A8H7D7X1_9AGAR|nr:hypothetical protein MVEN_00337100 [Mycena venus]
MGISSTRRPTYTITLPNDVRFDYAGLLPGSARYAIFHTRGSLYIYDVWSGLHVCKRTEWNLTHWGIDLVPVDVTVRIFGAVSLPGGLHQISIDEIDEVDPTSVPREVFRFDSPTTQFGSFCGLVGDFFLYTLPPWMSSNSDVETILVLVNWRASTYIVLNYGTTTRIAAPKAILIPGYIIATHSNNVAPYRPHSLILTVTALDAFSPYWKPLSTGIDLAGQLSPHSIPSAASQRLEYKNQPLGSADVNVALSAFASALYRGAYTIVVYAGELPSPQQFTKQPRTIGLVAQMGRLMHMPGRGRRNPGPELQPEAAPRLALLSFKLTPPPTPGQPCRLRLVSAERAAPRCESEHLLTPRAVINRSGGSYVVSYCYPWAD